MKSPHSVAAGVAMLVAVSVLSHPLHADAFRLEPAGADPSMLASLDAGVAGDGASNTSMDRVEVEPYAIGASDYNGTTIFVGGVCAQWFVVDGLSVGVFAEALHVNQSDQNAIGGGAGVLLRWHFVRAEDIGLFVDVGVGCALFDHPVPSDAQSFDFTPRASFGIAHAIDPRTSLDASIGWLHISNAQTGEFNPGLDTLAIGLSLRIEY